MNRDGGDDEELSADIEALSRDARDADHDEDIKDWIRGPSPDEQEIQAVFQQAGRLAFYAAGSFPGQTEPEGELAWESSDPAVLATVAGLLRLGAPDGGGCRCYGSLSFELTTTAGERLILGTIYHGTSLGWSRGRGQALLLDPLPFLEWLAQTIDSRWLEEYQLDHAADDDDEFDENGWSKG